jgi:AmiR/NasT family two-component response regulator
MCFACRCRTVPAAKLSGMSRSSSDPLVDTPVLALAPTDAELQTLQAALVAAGVDPVHGALCADAAQACVTHAPQLLLAWLPGDAAALAPLLATWGGQPPCALALVAPDPGPLALLELATAGLHAWLPVLDAATLPSLLAMAQGRHDSDAALRREAADLRAKFDERKWVDRAKGLLMDARGLSEDEAFKLLRNTAMQANLKLPDVARSVLDAARWAEAVNRAGQLRMLSQRLVALAAQRLAHVDGARLRQTQALQRTQDNIDFLAALALPDGQAAQARQQVCADWDALKACLGTRGGSRALLDADARAEALLQAAETLTAALQALGTRATLGVVNLCGRQRMHSQRVAKEALLATLLPDDPARAARMQQLMTDFERALIDIEAAPLSSADIRSALQASREGWLQLLRALRGHDATALAGASEQLLLHLDALTDSCERSLQVLLS